MNTTKEKIQEAIEAVKPKKRKPDPKKIGRNERCPCGSEKKYKKCCLITKRKEQEEIRRRIMTPPEPIEDQSNTSAPRSGLRRRRMPITSAILMASALMGGFHDTSRK